MSAVNKGDGILSGGQGPKTTLEVRSLNIRSLKNAFQTCV